MPPFKAAERDNSYEAGIVSQHRRVIQDHRRGQGGLQFELHVIMRHLSARLHGHSPPH